MECCAILTGFTEMSVNLPEPIKAVLSGFGSSGENLKTASESDVFRYVHADTWVVVFIKIQRPSWSPPLSIERDAMAWLDQKLSVPEVVAYCEEDSVEYLVTKALPGISSHERSCHGNKQRLVEQLAESLHTIHALPTQDCPFDRTPRTLIAGGRDRIEAELITTEMVADEELTGSPGEALDELERRIPNLEGPVTTHGDYCLPNVMIHDNQISGFIDLGYLGIGDPYRDFVAAQYSIRRNLGEEWVQPFFDAYGRKSLDEEKLQWYRQIQTFV